MAEDVLKNKLSLAQDSFGKANIVILEGEKSSCVWRNVQYALTTIDASPAFVIEQASV